MKKSLVLAMAMALGVTASAYAANPFSDVPAGHWAYDLVLPQALMPQILSVMYRQATGLMTQLTNLLQKVW